uniref:Sialidase domain-containing protein n=1 Tax=Alexandrium monilatum TaxID=311494 RepID=A0A7S4SAV6_9DINO
MLKLTGHVWRPSQAMRPAAGAAALISLALAAPAPTAGSPGGSARDCQADMDAYCQVGCYGSLKHSCDKPMVARFSGPGSPAWNCYSQSALENNQTYDGKSPCRCSRGPELAQVLSQCFGGVATVFSPQMEGSACYRIPALVHLPSGGRGTLLAFAEQRVHNCSDDGVNSIVVRRSLDGGESWEPRIITVADGGGQAFSNSNPVAVTFPNGTRAVLLHYDTLANPTEAHRGRNMQRWSFDDGLTWTEPVDITKFMPKGFAGCMPGPASGVFNAKAGRIYFSCYGFGPKGFLYWSSDWGESWQHSDVHSPLVEPSIALLTNGSVAMNCRSGRTFRTQMTWSENGTLLSQISRPAGLIDPNCQGSLVSLRQTADRGALDDHLFLSNNNTTSGRSHITIKRSVDAGASWDSGHLVWAGPSGYSSLAAWEHEDGSGRHWMGLFFELGTTAYVQSLGFHRWVVEDMYPPPSTARVSLDYV